MFWPSLSWSPAIAAPDLSHSHFTLIATTFLIAGLAYVAVSLASIPFLRSGAWTVGFAGWVYLAWFVVRTVTA